LKPWLWLIFVYLTGFDEGGDLHSLHFLFNTQHGISRSLFILKSVIFGVPVFIVSLVLVSHLPALPPKLQDLLNKYDLNLFRDDSLNYLTGYGDGLLTISFVVLMFFFGVTGSQRANSTGQFFIGGWFYILSLMYLACFVFLVTTAHTIFAYGAVVPLALLAALWPMIVLLEDSNES
jgi:hypothetical protein